MTVKPCLLRQRVTVTSPRASSPEDAREFLFRTVMFNTVLSPSITAVVLIYLTFRIGKLLYSLASPLRSPLRALPGPKGSNFIWGNLKEIFKSGPYEIHLKWAYEYGPTLVSYLRINSQYFSYELSIIRRTEYYSGLVTTYFISGL